MSFFFLCLSYGIILALLLIGAYILAWVARPLFRLFAACMRVFGDTWQARLLGLGVVALIFDDTTMAICRVPVDVLVAGFDILTSSADSLRRILAQVMGDAADWRVLDSPTEIVRVTGRLFDEEFRENLSGWSRLKSNLFSLPYDLIWVAVAVWVLLGQMFSIGQQPEQFSLFSRFSAWFRADSKRSQDILLWLTIAAGAYLSLAAIIATGELKTPGSLSAAEQKTFSDQLTDILEPQEKVDKSVAEPVFSAKTALDEMEAVLITASTHAANETLMPTGARTARPAGMPAEPTNVAANAAVITANPPVPADAQAAVPTPPPGSRADQEALPITKKEDAAKTPVILTNLAELQSWVSQSKSLLESVAEKWKNKSKGLLDFRERLQNTSKEHFEEHAEDMTSRGRKRFARDLLQANLENWSEWKRELGYLRGRLNYLDRGLEEEARSFLSAYNRGEISSTNYYVRRPPVELLMMDEYDRETSMTLPLPSEASLLGPFQYIADWLVDVDSLALTLVTGMLGFGIVGSATSSFVKQKQVRAAGGPLVPDLASVIIRGMSAAVVVFLSVKGGLAIFSAAETDPNAYVLFFTCFAGAVFSENIWEWAKEKLVSTFPNDGNGSGREADDGAKQDAHKEAAKGSGKKAVQSGDKGSGKALDEQP